VGVGGYSPGMAELSHLDAESRANMVDVGGKSRTLRRAAAEGFVKLGTAHLAAIDKHPKGDVFTVAQIAGIQAAKRTWELIPLCHQISLSHVSVTLSLEDGGIRIRGEADAEAGTGVEMEALAAVSVAALTVYDMLKSAGHGIEIKEIRLLEKTGGKEDWKRKE
jgi:cyclic pyranopterin phosphate synthase